MNKCTIPITLTSLLLLSNCAKIKEYRNYGKEKKVTRSMTIENSPFPNKLKGGRVVRTQQPQLQNIAPVKIPNTPTFVEPTRIKPAPIPTPTATNPGRVIPDFIEPDITGLPDNKDLQESDNITPIKPIAPSPSIRNNNPIIRDPEPLVPTIPFQNDPNDGLIPPP